MTAPRTAPLCVYCATARADTHDHVFARAFFLVADRARLPKVPACEPCNHAKSEIESYLATLLPLGGRHPSSDEYLRTFMPGRLGGNHRLHRDVVANAVPVDFREGGSLVRMRALPLDHDRIIQLLALVARGLVWFHWKVLIPAHHHVRATALTVEGAQRLAPWFDPRTRTAARVEKDLGHGTIVYEGIQNLDVPEATIWRVRLFGGVAVTDRSDVAETSTVFGVATGPPAASAVG